jgi:hypothetical protein
MSVSGLMHSQREGARSSRPFGNLEGGCPAGGVAADGAGHELGPHQVARHLPWPEVGGRELRGKRRPATTAAAKER